MQSTGCTSLFITTASHQSALLSRRLRWPAHRVLVNYFPAQQADLDGAFTKSLNAIIASAQAKADGTATGEAAAAILIAARAGDGLEANVPYTTGNGPGVWQPTPPAFLAALTPWLGQMRPFTMKSADQFLPAGPTPLTSERWVVEYNVTRLFGDMNSTVRTVAQGEIGLFWAGHTGQQYSRAFGYLAQNYKLDVMDSARLLAVLWTGYADTGIACWNAKFTYNFWRPVTAIRSGGGNSELMADGGWTSLATTPNHPEYPAAHGCVTEVSSSLVADFFGTAKVHVVVDNNTTFSDGLPHAYFRRHCGLVRRGVLGAHSGGRDCIFIIRWRTVGPSAGK